MPARNPTDEGVDLDLLAGDPYPVFDRLRQEAAAVWAPRLGVWLVARYEVCRAILADPERFTVESDENILASTIGEMMLAVDGPRHKRYRRPFARPLKPGPLHRDGVDDDIRREAHRLIDGFVDGGAADLRARFARPLAMAVVAGRLGIPHGDLMMLFDAIAAGFANQRRDPQVAAAGRAAFARFRELLARAEPAARFRGIGASAEPPLDPDELASNTAISVFGGFETTAALIGNTLWAIHANDLWAVAGTDEAPWDRLVEETLRWASPVQTATRHVVSPTTLGTVALAPGDTVQCLLGAANRDPVAFPGPASFRLDRPPVPKPIAFAAGPHLCIGARLARMEAAIALEVLVERLPGLRLAPGSPPPRGHEFRSPPAVLAVW